MFVIEVVDFLNLGFFGCNIDIFVGIVFICVCYVIFWGFGGKSSGCKYDDVYVFCYLWVINIRFVIYEK